MAAGIGVAGGMNADGRWWEFVLLTGGAVASGIPEVQVGVSDRRDGGRGDAPRLIE